MHASSVRSMRRFFAKYSLPGMSVLDIGSQVIMDWGQGGCKIPKYKQIVLKHSCKYFGLDVVPGSNVDIVVPSAYKWTNIKSDRYDLVISGQTLEHIQFFWLTFNEIIRVLKPGGHICIIVPSTGYYHNIPIDCWRFQKDSMKALEAWADYSANPVKLVETYIDLTSEWGDCVGVFRRLKRSEWRVYGRQVR